MTSPAVSHGPHWSLFADWCEASRVGCAPAAPADVLRFLRACPGKPATLRRRVAAIDATHRSLGLRPPGRHPDVVDHLREVGAMPPVREPVARFDQELVAAGLEAAAVRGWPDGTSGRRNAALTTAVCVLGLTRPQTTRLRLGDVRTGPLALAVGDRVIVVEPATEPGACPACTLSRWQRVADLYALHGMLGVRRSLAGTFRATAGDTDRHDCLRPLSPTRPEDADRPLFSPIDQHGWMAVEPLSIRSVTAIVTETLFAGHKSLVGRLLDDTRTTEPAAPVEPPTVLDRDEAVARKNAGLAQLSEVERLLDELDARIEAAVADSAEAVVDARSQAVHVASLRCSPKTAGGVCAERPGQ